MHSPKNTAKIAGVLYLLVILCAGFSQGYVRESLIVAGDAAATAQNIIHSEWLYRLGFVSDLVAFLCDLIISVLFYILLKPVNKTIALIAAFSRLLAHPAIASINLLNHFIALELLSGADYLAAFDTNQLHALVLLFLDMHAVGYLIGGAFFGLHLFFLGYLLFKSALFPNVLGILIGLAAAGYIIESFGTFLFPKYKDVYTWLVTVPAVIGELSLALWLLIKGVKTQS